MRKKSILTLLTQINGISAFTKLFSVRRAQKITSHVLIMTAVTLVFALNEAKAGFPVPPGLPGLPAPHVNVNVNGYLPAPPGVHVMVDSGRPYYVESDRRVYMERERPAKHYKKHKKHKKHHDHGHDRGHGRD